MSLKVDIGEDKNIPLIDPKSGKSQTASTSLLEDLARNPEDALAEARNASWNNWIASDPLITAHADEEGKVYLFFLAEQIKGKVLILDVWDYTLLHSHRHLHYMREWHKRYSASGLQIIGIHSPLFEFGKDKKNILDAVRDLGISYPVVMDNDYLLWRSLENRYWPRRVLIGIDGKFHADQTGEEGYAEFEKTIQKLLRELSPGLSCPPVLKPLYPTDPTGFELFFGTNRKLPIGNTNSVPQEGVDTLYRLEPGRPYIPGIPYLEGGWVSNKESIHPVLANSKIVFKEDLKITLSFTGKKVYLVGRAKSKLLGDIPQSIKVKVFLDKKPLVDDYFGRDLAVGEVRSNQLIVREPKLYQVVKGLDSVPHEITFIVDNKTSDTLELFAIYIENA